MIRVCHVLFVLCLLPALLGASPAVAPAPGARPLPVGTDDTIEQAVPINIVLVGFRPEQIDRQTLLEALPATSRPGVRSSRFFYRLPGRDLGLAFHLRYRLIDAGRSFEDDLFAHLAVTGQPGPLTRYQQQYNDQERNVLDVAGPVLYLYRYEFAGYMQWSRMLGEAILASPEAYVVRHELIQAGRSAVRAQRGFQRWDYLRAAAEARAGYETLQRAADRIGVHVDSPYAAAGGIARTTPHERVERRIDWEHQ